MDRAWSLYIFGHLNTQPFVSPDMDHMVAELESRKDIDVQERAPQM